MPVASVRVWRFLNHHWDRCKVILCFGKDWIKTLVYMATESSQRLLWGKRCVYFLWAVFDPIPVNFQVTRTCITPSTSLNLGQIRLTSEFAALECLVKSHRLIMGKWFRHFLYPQVRKSEVRIGLEF